MAKKNKKRKGVRVVIKLLLCLIYIGTIFILVSSGFRLYEEDKKIVKWKDVTSTREYSYIEISQMSEAFAVINNNKQIHFVIEQTKKGVWHTYLIAINKKDYDKYKNIIDYSYERTDKKPNKIKVYGYPSKITNNIKKLAIKNISNFVPIENNVVIDNKNFEEYLTNTYLDTTKSQKHETNYIIVALLIMALILFILIVFTLFDKDKIVDEVDELIEKEIDKEEKKINDNKIDDDIEIL